jgi:peptide/nickel transport system permease protein
MSRRMTPSLVLGVVLVTSVVGIALLAPHLSRHELDEMDMSRRLAAPSWEHWLGTDNFGRDLWTRVAYGARLSLGISLTSVGIASVLGTFVGLLAGYFRGVVDDWLMRFADLFLGFPPFILALALVAALGPSAFSVVAALVAVLWTESARVVRAITLSEVERDYVSAARALGASHARILVTQLLPRTLGPLVVLSSLGIGTAIVAESGLSFLGFGVQPPTPTWGWTLAYGMRYLRTHIWLSTVPGLAILITVLGFHLVGDGLRDRLDPMGAARQPGR